MNLGKCFINNFKLFPGDLFPRFVYLTMYFPNYRRINIDIVCDKNVFPIFKSLIFSRTTVSNYMTVRLCRHRRCIIWNFV